MAFLVALRLCKHGREDLKYLSEEGREVPISSSILSSEKKKPTLSKQLLQHPPSALCHHFSPPPGLLNQSSWHRAEPPVLAGFLLSARLSLFSSFVFHVIVYSFSSWKQFILDVSKQLGQPPNSSQWSMSLFQAPLIQRRRRH